MLCLGDYDTRNRALGCLHVGDVHVGAFAVTLMTCDFFLTVNTMTCKYDQMNVFFFSTKTYSKNKEIHHIIRVIKHIYYKKVTNSIGNGNVYSIRNWYFCI